MCPWWWICSASISFSQEGQQGRESRVIAAGCVAFDEGGSTMGTATTARRSTERPAPGLPDPWGPFPLPSSCAVSSALGAAANMHVSCQHFFGKGHAG